MKAKFYWMMVVVAIMMSNCSQEEIVKQSQNVTKSLTATIEGASRSTVTDGGIFSWTSGDQISVWNGTGFDIYTNNGENTFTGSGTPIGYAIYPAGNHSVNNNGTVTINLPGEYDMSDMEEYNPDTHAPMLATIEEGSNELVFKHVGGLMRFIVKNVPAGANQFVFEAKDAEIVGNFEVSDGQISRSDDFTASSSVTIKFNTLESQKDKMVFYVPLPVGEYTGYSVSIKGEDNLELSDNDSSVSSSNTIKRRTLLWMPEFSCVNDELVKASSSQIVTPDSDGETLNNVTGGTVNIGETAQGSGLTATINFTPSSSDAVLSIVDASSATTPQQSTATVDVKVTTGETVEALNIEAPKTTVELSTSSGGTATYQTVIALTATQTLKVKNGITIERLILKGGNVDIEEGATVHSFEYEASEGVGVICVKFVGNVPEGLVSTDKIIYLPNDGVAVSTLGELNTALTNNEIGTIVLKNDIESDAIVNINRAVTLDLNQKTFSCTFNRFIRVENSTSNENAVTIKNGTISNGVSGGRCVETRSGNINLTLENLTLETTASSGWNQPFTIGGSGTNITVDITDCTIDAGAPGYGITTFNPVVMTIKNTTISGYSALNIKEADGSEGSKNSTFNIINSTLESINNASTDETNNFTTVMIEDDDIVINVDATSKLSAKANNNNQSIFCIGNELISEAITGVTVTVENGATLTLDGNNTYIFVINQKQVLGDNVFKFPANYAGQLNSEGYKTETENGLVKVVAVCEAKIGDVLYETLSSAIEDASENDVVTLIKNVVIPANTVIPDGVTIDGANKSVSTDTESGVHGAGKGVFQLADGTIKNVIFDSPNTQYDIIVTAAGSIIEGCEFKTASQVVNANATPLGKRAIYTEGTSVLEGELQVTDCIFDDQVYAFNFSNDKNKMDIKFDNCTLGGWLSGYGKSHTFTNCTFKESGGYKNYIPYCPVTFNQCDFLDDFTISLKKGSTYTFDENCTYSSYLVTEPGQLTWDFSGGTEGVGDNEISETVTIGTKSWINNEGEGGNPIWNEVTQ